jgi:hypothetical protein
MVFSTTWLEFKDMAQDPLVRREPVTASCNRRPDEGLETQRYNLYATEHPANCPLRLRLSNGLVVGRLMTLLDLSPADFRRFLTLLVDRGLLSSQCCLSTGLIANGIRLTKRCNALSSRSDVRIWVFKFVFCFFNYSFSVSMVRRRISEAQRWQIIGMHTTGMSFKAIERQMG